MCTPQRLIKAGIVDSSGQAPAGSVFNCFPDERKFRRWITFALASQIASIICYTLPPSYLVVALGFIPSLLTAFAMFEGFVWCTGNKEERTLREFKQRWDELNDPARRDEVEDASEARIGDL